LGSSRLNQIVLAGRGMPWLGIAVVTAPALVLTVCAFAFHQSAVAWVLLRSGILILVVAVAFVLDDRLAAVTTASPRSPGWWFSGRILGGAPLLVIPIAAGLVWAIDHPDVDPWGLALQTTSAWMLVLAGAAVARRLGRNTPGNLVASGAVLVVLFLLIFPIRIRGVPLLPFPGDARWDQSTALWSIVGMTAVLAIAVASGWRPPPKHEPTSHPTDSKLPGADGGEPS
jgi:hypothetical protein